MKVKAYAKINLALDVLGIREDSYHELRMIMVPIDFFDEIEIIRDSVTSFSAVNRKFYFDDNNTIVKALKMMKEEFDIRDNFNVSIKKLIPIKAGLAGGSTDGAAVIRCINKMYSLNLSEEKIKELCLKIGADVLFNYYSRPSLVEGIGDKLSFIDIKDGYYVLLVKPRGGVSTKECYKNLDENNLVHPDIDLILEKLKNGEEVKEYLKNSLEDTAISLCDDIAYAKKELLNTGADFTLVTGSGSTVFTIDRDYRKIMNLRCKMLNKGFFVRSAKILKNYL